jgi:LDH2 family malate/lactate/ureidoglycolate dehydrogenase
MLADGSVRLPGSRRNALAASAATHGIEVPAMLFGLLPLNHPRYVRNDV